MSPETIQLGRSIPALRLRPAVLTDCLGIWLWRNLPESRAASCNPEPIPYAEHRDWFYRALGEREGIRAFILENHSGTPIGTLNWAISVPLVARVSIILDPGVRGQWLATSAINLLAEQAKEAGYRVLEAIVRPENAPSLKAFMAAGFKSRAVTDTAVWLLRDL